MPIWNQHSSQRDRPPRKSSFEDMPPKELLIEVAKRQARIETKIHLIADHLKVDLKMPVEDWLDEKPHGNH